MDFWLLFPIFLTVWTASLIVRFFWHFGKGVKQEAWPEIKRIWQEEKERKREQKMRDAQAHEDLDSTAVQAERDDDS